MSTLDQFTESDASDHEQAIETIAGVLRNDHRGKSNAIPSSDLAEHTPVSASTVRDLIPEVRRRYGLPIGSSNGYFVIVDHDEFVKQVERQKQQAETSLRTARDIASAWNGSRINRQE